jgi:regulator of sirC expression with transglutaminase-like and TPR domain
MTESNSQLSAGPARRRFAEIVSLPDDELNLAEAALLISAEEYVRLNVAHYIDRLDRFGDRAREIAVDAIDSLDVISALNVTLFDELGFRGNRESYYDPRNSYLNEVIDRKLGIPITLSIVYIEVARRIGFPVQGVSMPGHFLAKHVTDEEEIFIDPFHEGRVMGSAGCAELLCQVTGGRMQLGPEHLKAATKKQILTRMLSNILAIYSESNDHIRALAAIERILLINPNSASYVRDRGFLLAALDRPNAAVLELKRYLEMNPHAADADTVKEQIKTIKQKRARLN